MNEENSSRGQQMGVKSDYFCAAQVTFADGLCHANNENTVHINT